jgi:hypothetical protein
MFELDHLLLLVLGRCRCTAAVLQPPAAGLLNSISSRLWHELTSTMHRNSGASAVLCCVVGLAKHSSIEF